MHQNPPPHLSQSTAPTEPLPERSSRNSFYLAVGCLSVIAGLVLGVGGFFGVRAFQDGGGTSIAGGDSDGGGDGAESTPPALDEIPVGPDDAVPFGSTFPIYSTTLEGEVHATATAVDWDATAEILAVNSLTQEPEEGNKYVMLTLEGVYHGGSDYSGYPEAWMGTAYVAEDGTTYGRTFVVTPHYDDVVEQSGVPAGGSFLSELTFEIPAGIEGGGHFVLFDDLQDTEEGAWMAAS